MPIDARSIPIKAPEPIVPVDVSDHLRAIDAILSREWSPYDLRDDPPDHYAGRSYDVTQLTRQEREMIGSIYVATGWKVIEHGGRFDNAYTRNPSVFLRFIPPQVTR